MRSAIDARHRAAVLRLLLILSSFALGGCAAGPTGDGPLPLIGEASEADLARAAEWLEGSFSSAEQAASDDRYFEVNLHHARIWDDRDDGVWLYVEQALATDADEPYRQRIYRVWLRPDGRVVSTVYELPEPERFAGAWRDPGSLDTLSPLSLDRRDGCTIVFTEIAADRMIGSTQDTGCTSTLRGASYATSEVTLTADGITSWDRGFDASDEQVWGAEAGPYEFRRVDR